MDKLAGDCEDGDLGGTQRKTSYYIYIASTPWTEDADITSPYNCKGINTDHSNHQERKYENDSRMVEGDEYEYES